jgi:protein TonB
MTKVPLRRRDVLLAAVVGLGLDAALVLAFAKAAVAPAPRPAPAPREVEMAVAPPPPPEPPRRPPPEALERPEARPDPAPRAELRAPELPSAFQDPGVGPPEAELGPPVRGPGEGEASAPRVKSADEVSEPPKTLQRRLPRYPAAAAAAETEGVVVLELLIDATGRVARARVVEARPPGVFESAALSAIRGWRFRPARDGGERVPVLARKTLRFELR